VPIFVSTVRRTQTKLLQLVKSIVNILARNASK
jgi:hypothetical protein